MPRTYEPITTQTLGSNQSTITLSSIPGTYTDLVIVANGVSTSGGGMKARFNGDAGANYSFTYIYGDGSNVVTSRVANDANGVVGSRIGIGSQGGGVMQINNYSDATTFKSMLSRQFGQDQIAWYAISRWRSTAAITSMVFSDESGGQFATGFTITLYGIKAA
jgi:hypothetical protein